jgi:hypothetical protein
MDEVPMGAAREKGKSRGRSVIPCLWSYRGSERRHQETGRERIREKLENEGRCWGKKRKVLTSGNKHERSIGRETKGALWMDSLRMC